MNKTLSSVDLFALEREFQVLVRAKLQQIYHPSKTEFCLHFHVPGKGKQYMRIIAGKMINFASEKRSSLKPSGLTMLLRKHISGAVIEKVWQRRSERIIIFDLIMKDKKFHLIVELFSKGNVVLCDSNWKILALQSWQLRRSGAVKMKQEYKFPESLFNWKECNEAEFAKVVLNSDKKNLATALATEIGLGGNFAEEICVRSGIDAKLAIKEVSTKEIKKMFLELTTLKKELEVSRGYVFEKEISAVKLLNSKAEKLLEEKESFSSALDLVNPLVKVSPYLKKIERIEKIIEKQEEACSLIEKEIEQNSLKGELIYEKYSDIAKLQEVVAAMKKTKSWDEIKKELEKLSKVKSLDLKKKAVVLDL
ncbi:hypothetical protein CL619_02745 [archaeon]|nr:hypothetical protein [archaeon]|tara:strand:+ start:2175 stop:3269 length:1095 start_codon:yes stop_codon:yes gene_type:complete